MQYLPCLSPTKRGDGKPTDSGQSAVSWVVARMPNQMVCCQGVIFDPLAGPNGVRLLSTP